MSYIGNEPTTQSLTHDTFSGDASTVAFVMSHNPGSASAVIVHVGGVWQEPSVGYTVSGGTITFTSAPPTGTNNISVVHLGVEVQVPTPADGSVTTAKLAAGSVDKTKLDSLVIPIGVDQTWQDLLASRAFDTTYTNTTGRPIGVYVYASMSAAQPLKLTVGGIDFYSNYVHTSGARASVGMVIVPNGATYSLSSTNATSIIDWSELR